MQVRSRPDPILRPRAPRSSGILALLFMFASGLMVGALVTAIVGYGLVLYGYLPGADCLAPNACPATPAFYPVCPTCAAEPLATAEPQGPTPSTPEPATPTPDIGPTATAACATWQAQFPATPCP